MLPTPKDENIEIDSSAWDFDPGDAEYDEEKSDNEIVDKNPEAFDYSETDETPPRPD